MLQGASGLPDLMAILPTSNALSLYQANPFHVLVLRSTASSQEVQRKSKEITLRIRMNELDGDEEQIKAATQCLSDPRRRLVAELFWFFLDSPTDAQAYDQFLAGDVDEA